MHLAQSLSFKLIVIQYDVNILNIESSLEVIHLSTPWIRFYCPRDTFLFSIFNFSVPCVHWAAQLEPAFIVSCLHLPISIVRNMSENKQVNKFTVNFIQNNLCERAVEWIKREMQLLFQVAWEKLDFLSATRKKNTKLIALHFHRKKAREIKCDSAHITGKETRTHTHTHWRTQYGSQI